MHRGSSSPASVIRCRLSSADVSLQLHSGYDWFTTRKAIAEEAKAVRRRLEKIRQLLASGQTSDASAEQASVLMFGSLQLGLAPGSSELPKDRLLQAIDEELKEPERDDEADDDTATVSSWQTFPGGGATATGARTRAPPATPRRLTHVGKARRRLTRSKAYAIAVNLNNVAAQYDTFHLNAAAKAKAKESQVTARVTAEVRDFEIIDNIKTSTWRKFLTELRASDGGEVRATGASMLRFELNKVASGSPSGAGQDAALANSLAEELMMKVSMRLRAPRSKSQIVTLTTLRGADQDLSSAAVH